MGILLNTLSFGVKEPTGSGELPTRHLAGGEHDISCKMSCFQTKPSNTGRKCYYTTCFLLFSKFIHSVWLTLAGFSFIFNVLCMLLTPLLWDEVNWFINYEDSSSPKKDRITKLCLCVTGDVNGQCLLIISLRKLSWHYQQKHVLFT